MEIYHEIIKSNHTIRLLCIQGKPYDHWHQRTEFLLVHSGNCRVWIDKEEFQGKPGDVFVIHSGEIHTLTCEKDCLLYICTFDPAILYSFQPEVTFLRKPWSKSVYWSRCAESLQRCFGRSNRLKIGTMC